MLKKIVHAMSFVVATISPLYAASSTECSATDSKDVRTAIEDYVSKNTSVPANEIDINSQKCMNNYASAIVHPHKPVTDDATVYLEKKDRNGKF